jgi:hypothetical protein
MITKLTLENFYAVRDRLEIDLAISGHVVENLDRYGPLFPGSNARAPKVIAIYGPNAAGKSTILRGLSFIATFLEHGFTITPEEAIFCHRFNSDPHRTGEMKIGIEFGAPSNLTDSTEECPYCRYAYDLTLDGGDTDQPTRIKYESLSYWPADSSRRLRVFEREGDRLKSGGRAFRLQGFTRPLSRVLRPNVSLISTLVQLGHEPSIWLRDFAARMQNNILMEKFDFNEHYIARQYLEDESLLIELNQQIRRLDFGIKEVHVSKDLGNRYQADVKFSHGGLSSPLEIASESHGTRHFFGIFPTISQALKSGGIAIVDELDSSIHPLLLPEIMRWFYDGARNPKNAQIWFTCQNPYLLQELSKDEILFCEKHSDGCASAFSLNSVSGVRRIDNYAKKYLGGAYGAIPHIG